MEAKAWVMPTHIIAVGGIVENDKGEVLMVNTHNHGWVFPGGQVEVGENLIEGLKREIMEETGIEAQVGELFCVSSNTRKHAGTNGVKEVPTKLMLDFICKAVSGTPRPSDENTETIFIDKSRALSIITAPAIIERYKAFMEYDGEVTYLAYVTRPYALQLKTHI